MIIVVFFTVELAAAQNLIPNSSFETHTSIPNGYGQWYVCSNWNSVNNHAFFAWPWASPDYLHASASIASGVQLPSTTFGTIGAHAGSAIMGFVAWLANTPDFREYLSVQLTSPMVVGTAYEVSFYITNGTNNYSGSACNHIAANFSTAPLTQVDHEPINVTPQCDYASQLWNTTWTKISFTITPTVAYQYITIGNFKNDANTSHTWHGVGQDGAYYFIDDAVVQPAVVLPVQLISFTGFHSEKGNELRWQTASEFNTDHFSIEKSIDGNLFDEIASVTAKGFAQQLSVYQYTDVFDLQALDYYRLKMVDVDGSFTYSNTIEISGDAGLVSAELFSNPAEENLLVQYSVNQSAPLEIFIFNSVGSLVIRESKQAINATGTFSVNIAALPQGIYLVKIEVGKNIFTKKFVK